MMTNYLEYDYHQQLNQHLLLFHHGIQSNCTYALQYYYIIYLFIYLLCSTSSTKVSFISALNFLNGVQFLNVIFVLLLLLLAPKAAIFPVTITSEQSQRLDSNEPVKNLIGFSCE